MNGTFGKNLKSLRDAMKVSQDEVAKATGIGSSTLSKYERGVTDPAIWNVVKLADYFGVTIEELAKQDYGYDPTVINKVNASKLYGYDAGYIDCVRKAASYGLRPKKLIELCKLLGDEDCADEEERR